MTKRRPKPTRRWRTRGSLAALNEAQLAPGGYAGGTKQTTARSDWRHTSGRHAKKSLGQNFLVDQQAIDDIISAIDPRPGENILEIGPGHGVLTRPLAAHGSNVVAVELDEGLIPELRRLPIRVIQQDILRVDPGSLFQSPYKVAGNIPYYISSPILRHFLEAHPQPSRLVLTLQKEVAERITAGPGHLSLLAVSVQLYGRAEIVRYVPAAAFRPVPKVDSAVVRIDVYAEPAVRLVDPERFFRVLKAGFAEGRKQVHNSLQRNYKPAGAHTRASLEPSVVSEALRLAGVDPTRRAETLSLQEWAAVVERLATD